MNSSERAQERRSRDRRGARRTAAGDESWFGAFSADADTQAGGDDSAPARASGYKSHFDQPTQPQESKALDDSRFLARQAARMVESGQTAFERLYRAFIAARAALGLALVVALAVGRLFGLRPTVWVTLLSVAYAVLSISLWALPRYGGFQRADAGRLKTVR